MSEDALLVSKHFKNLSLLQQIRIHDCSFVCPHEASPIAGCHSANVPRIDASALAACRFSYFLDEVACTIGYETLQTRGLGHGVGLVRTLTELEVQFVPQQDKFRAILVTFCFCCRLPWYRRVLCAAGFVVCGHLGCVGSWTCRVPVPMSRLYVHRSSLLFR